MVDIGCGVVEGFSRERTPSPIRSLEPCVLSDSYAQQIFDEGCQPDSGQTGKAGGDVGIVQVADTKSVMPIEAADVVVRSMNDFGDGSICKNFFEGSNVIKDDRVDDVDFVTGGNLNQAELLGVVEEAVRLGIKGDVSRVEHCLNGSVKLSGLADDFDGKRWRDNHESSILSHKYPYNCLTKATPQH